MKIDGIGINSAYNSYGKSNINKDDSKTEIKSRNKYYGRQEELERMAEEKYNRLYHETKHMPE